jgi:hypothetical protein
MPIMFKHLFTPKQPRRVRKPDPQPRMRWYA